MYLFEFWIFKQHSGVYRNKAQTLAPHLFLDNHPIKILFGVSLYSKVWGLCLMPNTSPPSVIAYCSNQNHPPVINAFQTRFIYFSHLEKQDSLLSKDRVLSDLVTDLDLGDIFSSMAQKTFSLRKVSPPRRIRLLEASPFARYFFQEFYFRFSAWTRLFRVPRTIHDCPE